MALEVKNLPTNTGDIRDVGLIAGSGRFLGGGNGNPFQYLCLENPMDRGAWWATAHGVEELDTEQACTVFKLLKGSHPKGLAWYSLEC